MTTTFPETLNDLEIKVEVDHVNFWYGKFQALYDINLRIPSRHVTALIGPSGCGKSTFLRCLNRMNDLIEGTRLEGRITIDGVEIYDAPDDQKTLASKLLGPMARQGSGVDPVMLRKVVGMVFQKPNPFPKSIYENIAYGPRLQGIKKRSELDDLVEQSLTRAYLWNEVKDKLKQSALGLSGGQQQRLCIARTIAVDPEVILMDEPCSALDPVATQKIEDLMLELKKNFTIVIVTHNMQQAQRASDYTAFFMQGKIEEFNQTEELFLNPKERQTEDYISGRFG